MKKKIILVIFTALVIFACKKEDELIIQAGEKKSEIDSKIGYKLDYFEDYIYPVAYYGDTAQFSLKYIAKTKISDIEITFVPKYQTNERRIQLLENVKQSDSLFFQIPITEEDFAQQFTETYFALFKTKYISEDKVVYTDSFNIFIKPLEQFSHLRLYNIASMDQKNKGYLYSSASYLSGILFTQSSTCYNCIKTRINDSTLFLVNTPHNDYDFVNDLAITKDFIHGFYVPQANNSYAKINNKVSFSAILQPKDILDIYNSLTLELKTKFENIKVGDQFIYKYVYPKPFMKICRTNPVNCISIYYGNEYGIFEITHIEDDGLTSKNGGNENDYNEFRLKSFGNTYRFKR